MTITPRNILQHELIGLDCQIKSAKNSCQIGIKGRIIDESLKIIKIKTGKKILVIPKAGTIFRINLSSQKVDISGNMILARPEDRIKKRLKKW